VAQRCQVRLARLYLQTLTHGNDFKVDSFLTIPTALPLKTALPLDNHS
jgi:hypothetical protein